MSLDPSSLDAAFPYRLAVGPDRVLAHVGPALAALVPGAAPGVPLAELFRLIPPEGEPAEGGEVVVESRAGLRLSGAVVRALDGTLHILARPARDRDHAAAVLLGELARLGAGTLDASLRRLLRADADVLEFERVSFWVRRADGSAIVCDGLHQRTGERFERGVELAAADFPSYFAALATGGIIDAADAHADPRTREFSETYLTPLGIGAMLDVPVYARGELVGVLCHEHVGGRRHFSAHEQQIALAVAQALAQLLEADARRRAEETARASEARLRKLVDVAPIPMLVSRASDGRYLYANDELAKVLRVSRDEILAHATTDFYAEPAQRQRLVGLVRQNGFVREEELLVRRPDGTTFWAMLSIDPILFDGEPGFLAGLVDLTEHKRAVAALAERDAIITRDLERARAFQDSMLPAPPARPDLRIDSAFHALDQVSGDVYDFEVVGDGLLRLFIADACGHGVSAALTTMFLRSEYEVASRAELSPGRLLAVLNARVARYVGRLHMHFTALAMMLDLKSGRLVWASAGHPAPHLVRGDAPRELETGGPFVGLVPDVDFPEWAERLEPGDTICLVTDGISEARARDGSDFVDAGLREALSRAVRDGDAIAAAVLEDARRFAGALDDDATVLAATWKPRR